MRIRTTPSPEGRDHLVQRLYATLSDTSRWPAVMEAICCEFGASGAALVSQDLACGRGEIIFQCPHFDAADERQTGFPICRSVISCDADRQLRNGSVVFAFELMHGGTDCVDHVRLNETQRRLFGVLRRTSTRAEIVVLARRSSMPPFDADAKSRLSPLLGHLRQVRDLAQSMNAKLFERFAYTELLDHIPFACLLVNPNGYLRYMNRNAAVLLAEKRHLVDRSGRLCARTGDESIRLWRAIAKTARERNSGREHENHLTLAGGGAAPPILASIFAIDQADTVIPQRPESLIAIVAKDATGIALPAIDQFCDAYALTAAERRLVQTLADGHGLFEAAHTLGISRNTARTHIRHAYEKLGVHRQADLMRLLSRFGAV
jgi:DNA-binding CsgD family transcriptional regulator/PAS domain-containing protein